MSKQQPFIAPVCNESVNTVYQDESLIVIEKPSGLLSVPGRLAINSDSVQRRMEKQFDYIGIVHRLDMATSGLMVLALNKAANSELSRQFRERLTAKKYIAIVTGALPEQGEVDLPIIVDWPNRPKQKIDSVYGKPSLTIYNRLDYNPLIDQSRVELTPITGRSHQLRIHMAAIGHPILGCKFYADKSVYQQSPRLLLHAVKLGFYHPISMKWLEFDCSPGF